MTSSSDRWAEVAGIKVDEKQADFLRELSAYYIQTRYPEEIADMGREVKEGIAREILVKTEEVVIWLSSMR